MQELPVVIRVADIDGVGADHVGEGPELRVPVRQNRACARSSQTSRPLSHREKVEVVGLEGIACSASNVN